MLYPRLQAPHSYFISADLELGLNKLGDTGQLSPTQGEVLRRVAEIWRQQHRSASMLAWAERLNRWRIKR